MLVRIEEVIRGLHGTLVRFSCSAGTAVAVWRGDEVRESESHDVELDINDVLRWGEDILAVQATVESVKTSDSSTSIVAALEFLDADGSGALRLCDSIVLVDTTGLAPARPKMVAISCEHLALFPTNI